MSDDVALRAETLLKKHLTSGTFSYNYKLLSRELDINVKDAKKILYGFHQKHSDLLDASYVIIGSMLKEGKEYKVIKHTDDLAGKEGFSRVESVQIYAVTTKNIKVQEVLVDINRKVREFAIDEEKLGKWGVIRGSGQVPTDESIPSETARSTTSLPPSTVKKTEHLKHAKTEPVEEKKKKAVPDMGLLSERIRASNRPVSAEPVAKKKITQSPVGAAFSRKTPSNSKPSTLDRKSGVDEVEISDPYDDLNDEEFAKKKEAEKVESERKRKELASMFDDDDDDDDMLEMDEPKDKAIEEVEEDNKVIPEKRPLEDLEDIFDSSFSQSQSQSKTQEADLEESESKDGDNKKTSYYDKEGYLVTRIEKPETKPKNKSATPSQKATKSNSQASELFTQPSKKAKSGPKQQSSLMNFFGKK